MNKRYIICHTCLSKNNDNPFSSRIKHDVEEFMRHDSNTFVNPFWKWWRGDPQIELSELCPNCSYRLEHLLNEQEK